jgi:endonuclease G
MASKEERIATYLSRFMAAKGERAVPLRRRASGGAEGAESPVEVVARAGVQEILKNRVPAPEQAAGIEAIILPKIRPVLDIVDGDFQTDHPLWQKLNDDGALRARLQKVIPSIGRVELPGATDYPYAGTGFVVGDGMVMTNRHVAEIFSDGLGTRGLVFKSGRHAGMDFLHELDRPTGPTFAVRDIIMIHPYWDLALLAVDGLTAEPVRLSQRDPGDGIEREVVAIGYPAFDTRNDADVQNDLFRHVFGVKRMQPGLVRGRRSTESFGKMVLAASHDCSTLGGNSGSAIIDLDTGEVLGLHFGGQYQLMNFAVPAVELARDPRVVDTGAVFAGTPPTPQTAPDWQSWWNDADEAPSDSPRRRARSSRVVFDGGGASAPAAIQIQQDGSASPAMTIRVDSGNTSVMIVVAGKGGKGEVGLDTVEKMATPWHDDNYAGRPGYQAKFLGTEVPMPVPAKPSVVAKTRNGDSMLHYQNFSIVMHAKRRLALFTASNVTAEAKLKKPGGKTYTRKDLSGLGENDQERWFPDPRLDDEYQLPDVFFTKDDGAFDKGHIVRREDVAWGSSYALLRRANGDTYHVTNCSPQIADFNRSGSGDGNWGDLENHVLKGAKTERFCQFAGPVLDPNDRVYIGAGGGGAKLHAQIPSKFWKVIVAETNDGIASYGFLLEQDLSDVNLEFAAGPFKRFMEPIADLEKKTGVKFPKVVRDGDQHDTNEGIDLAFRAGITRRAGA